MKSMLKENCLKSLRHINIFQIYKDQCGINRLIIDYNMK